MPNREDPRVSMLRREARTRLIGGHRPLDVSLWLIDEAERLRLPDGSVRLITKDLESEGVLPEVGKVL